MLMIGKPLTPEQRLTKAIADLMGRPECAGIAGILMLGSHDVVDDRVAPTALTDGVNIKYGRTFITDMKDSELRFLVMHEVFHCIYKHLTTWAHLYKEDAKRANMACDYVINLKIKDLGDMIGGNWLQMPTGGLLDERFRDMSTAEVYKLLPEQDEGGGGGSGQGQGDGEGFDSHDWEAAQDMSDEEKDELSRTIDEALRQGELLAGKIGSGGDRLLQDLLKSKVNWREALREFVMTTCSGNDYSTWRRPNRRFVSAGLYMPSGITEAVGELVIAIDTSGSIGGRELAQFLGEVGAIASAVRPSGVRLLYWDTAVCRDEYYTQDALDRIVTSTKPAGGGGTMVECVPAYMKDKQIKPQAVVVLTDGYLGGSWGEWDCPVLWCIVGNDNASPTVGKAVHTDFN